MLCINLFIAQLTFLIGIERTENKVNIDANYYQLNVHMHF